jgi:hypothetical protein
MQTRAVSSLPGLMRLLRGTIQEDRSPEFQVARKAPGSSGHDPKCGRSLARPTTWADEGIFTPTLDVVSSDTVLSWTRREPSQQRQVDLRTFEALTLSRLARPARWPMPVVDST